MAFVDNYDPVLLNIKITSEGRYLLSQGGLNFAYFSLGDSYINYRYIDDPDNIKVLRPMDNQPNILSHIKKSVNDEQYNPINGVSSIPMIVKNESRDELIGFFDVDTNIIKDGEYIIGSDLYTDMSTIGSNNYILDIQKEAGFTYKNLEPTEGDLVMVRWSTKLNSSVSGDYVDPSTPLPIMVYQIQSVSGSLSGATLSLTVDRKLPDFTGLGTAIKADVRLIMGYERYTNEYRKYAVDYLSESTLSFYSNYEEYGLPFPLWNLNIVYSKDIAGVMDTYKLHDDYNSIRYAGFMSYVQCQEDKLDVLGIIHYSNPSPYNEYGEYLLRNNTEYAPKIHIPTIMWHKAPNPNMGIILSADSVKKVLTGETVTTNIEYYDMVDDTPNKNVVGKVFIDLKLFVIEDADLLFALSHKSNRNWTLPNFDINFSNGYGECGICLLSVVRDPIDTLVVTSPTSGGTDGSISYEISGLSAESNGKSIVEIYKDGSLLRNEVITGSTHNISGLEIGSYDIIITDIGIPSCTATLNSVVVSLATTTTTTTTTTLPPTTVAPTTLPPTTISPTGTTVAPCSGTASWQMNVSDVVNSYHYLGNGVGMVKAHYETGDSVIKISYTWNGQTYETPNLSGSNNVYLFFKAESEPIEGSVNITFISGTWAVVNIYCPGVV